MQRSNATEARLFADHHDTVVWVCQHLVEMLNDLVSKPALQRRFVVLMIGDAEMGDRIAPYRDRGLRIFSNRLS